MDAAAGLDRGLDVVLVAQRYAARGDQQVVPAGRLCQGVADGVQAVGQDAEVGDRASHAVEQAHDGIAVGVEDAARRDVAARVVHLVAGREHRRAQPAVHLELGPSHRCRKADLLGAQALVAGDDGIAGAHVLAGLAPVRTPFDARLEDHEIAVDPAVLLHEHGVRPLRHGGTGEDSQGLARNGRALQGMAGGNARGYRQAGLAVGGKVVEEDGVAVDRRIVLWRHVARRHHVLGEEAAEGRAQGNGFDGGHRHHPFRQQGQRLVQRHQFIAGSEAVILQRGHSWLFHRTR